MPDHDPRLARRARHQRLLQLGEIERLPVDRNEALHVLRHPSGWARLDGDLWSRLVIAIFGAATALAVLLGFASLYLTNTLPPRAAWIGDLRLARSYAERPLTSGALAGEDWLVLGTDGGGVAAYRRNSGRIGVWRSFTAAATGNVLPSDVVRSVAANTAGVWYVAGDSLAWSSPDLSQWRRLIDSTGFSAAPTQSDIIGSALSDDHRQLAVATAKRVGLYDTTQHSWIGEAQPGRMVRAVAFTADNSLVAGTDAGIFTYQIHTGTSATVITDSARSLADVVVARVQAGPEWVLAVTARGGLVGLPQARGSQWQWLVGESGFGGAAHTPQAALLDDTALWVGAGSDVGRYDLSTRSWQTSQPDESQVLSLAAFDGTIWAGTERGVYRHTSDGWTSVAQQSSAGARQLIVVGDRLWAVTNDGAIGSVAHSGGWHSALSSEAFSSNGANPEVTDVVSFQNAFWVASRNAGVASYSWETRSWSDRRAGLPSPFVARLHVHDGTLWALAGTAAGGAYPLFRWDGAAWVQETGLSGSRLASAGGTLWLLQGDGSVAAVRPQSRQIYFASTRFDPEKIRSFAADSGGRTMFIGGDEGVFAYDLDRRSWSQHASEPAVALTAESGRIVWVTPEGGLMTNSRLLPGPPASAPLTQIVTAALWRNQLWLSDGVRVAIYIPGTREWTAAPPLGDVAIRQLRVVGDTLLAVTSRQTKTSIYRFVESAQRWELASGDSSVTQGLSTADTLVYIDAVGSVHLLAKNGNSTWLSGTIPGIDTISAGLQTADGSFVVVTRAGFLGSYDPRSGTWSKTEVSNGTRARVAAAHTPAGETIYAAAGKLYGVGPGARQATVLADNVVDLAVLNDEPYVVTADGNLARWNGASLETVRAFPTLTTTLTIGQQQIDVGHPTEVVAADGRLWARHPSAIVAYEPRAGGLEPVAFTTPPPARAERLLADDGRGPLYAGNATACWELAGQSWQACTTADQLARPRHVVDDGYGGRWGFGSVTVTIDGLEIRDDRFVRDRARELNLDAQGNPVIRTDNGVWKLSLTSDRRSFADRVPEAAPFQGSSSTTTPLNPPGDPWRWEVERTPDGLSDQVHISWTAAVSFTRGLSEGRFTDDIATAIGFFEGRYWLGTRAGLWSIAPAAGPAGMRTPVLELPGTAVEQIVADDKRMGVAFEGGTIWLRQQGRWQRGTALPSMVPVRNELGMTLVEPSKSRPQLAPLGGGELPRFAIDRIEDIIGDGDRLWLVTPAGIQSAQAGPGGLQVLPQLDLASTSSSVHMRVIAQDGVLYARRAEGARIEYFRYETQLWRNVAADETPFAKSISVPVTLPNVPLRWIRSPDEDVVRPELLFSEAHALEWVHGRLAIDVVNGVEIDGAGRAILATEDGPYVYSLINERLTLSAAPEAGLVGRAPAVGPAPGRVWVESDKKLVGLQIDGTIVRGIPIEAIDVLRPAVVFCNGRWTVAHLPRTHPLISIEGLGVDRAVFGDDGRFLFDQVSDVASDRGRVLLATTAGLLVYPAAPLTSLTTALDIKGEPATRVTIVQGGVYVQAGPQSYRLEQDGLKADASVAALLNPPAARLESNGWSMSPLSVGKLSIAGLEQRPSLFTPEGKLLTDSALAVVAAGEKVWLLTRGGLVEAEPLVVPDSVLRLRTFGASAPPPNFNARMMAFETLDRLVADDPSSGMRLTWVVGVQSVGSPRSGPISGRVELVLAGYTLSAPTGGGVTISSKDGQATLETASEPQWQFDVPLSRRHIPQVITFLDDRNMVWAITAEGLVAISKHRVELLSSH